MENSYLLLVGMLPSRGVGVRCNMLFMDIIHGRYPWMRGPWGTHGAPEEQNEKNRTQDGTVKTRWRKNGPATYARLNQRGMSPGLFSMDIMYG